MQPSSLGSIGTRVLLALLSVVAAPLPAQTADPPTYPGISIPDPFTPGGGSADVPVYVEYDKRLRASGARQDSCRLMRIPIAATRSPVLGRAPSSRNARG